MATAAALALVIGIVGLLELRAQQRRFRRSAEAQLSSIADLKLSQVLAWRHERIADGAVVTDNPLLARELKSGYRQSPAGTTRDLPSWLESLVSRHGYSGAMLIGPAGGVLASAGKVEPWWIADAAPHISRVFVERSVLLTDIEAGRDGRVHLDVVAPVLDPDRPATTLAVVLLRIDPGDFLFPLVQSWPTPSTTAESALVEVDGNSVLFLNALRHRQLGPMSLRLPLDPTYPAARFVRGEGGIATAVDYRAHEVIAAGRHVPGTSWFVVAKIDLQEVMAPARAQAITLVAAIVLLMAGAVGTIALWWRHETARLERARYEEERAREARDAIERKAAMQALSFQAELVRNVYDAVIALDAEHVVQSWNPAAERIYGWRAEEVVGKRISAVLPSEYQGFSYARFVETLDRKGRLEFEVRRTARDGRSVDVEASAVVLHDAEGCISGYVTVNRDATHRKGAEAALRASQERLARILETSSEGIFIVDGAGRIEFVNERAARYLGAKGREVVGRPLLEVLPEAGRRDAAADLEAVLRGDGVKREFAIREPGVDDVWIDISWSALRDPHEAVVGGVCLFMDVTEHRRACDQLLHARKMDAVGRLASGIAHDFNNLLVSILTCSGFLVESLPEGDRRREDAMEIKAAGERAAQLVRQLLAFGRKSALRPVPVDLNTAVRGVEGILRRAIGEHVVMTVALEPSPWPTRIDPGQLEQVLMNLAVNARDAMVKGGELRIATSNVVHGRDVDGMAAGRYVVLEVKDTGCGMEPEVLTRIFEPFFTTKEKERGTGLGLSTVYAIVKEAGGTILVDSCPGRGATFKVHLPACEHDTRCEPAPAATTPVRGRGETVLLVEDEESVRRVVRRMLEEAGYSVVEALDPAAALRSVRECAAVDVVLSDVVMPHMSGTDLAAAVGALRPRLPVVLMSGYAESRPQRDGPRHVLGKPFSADDLAATIEEALHGRVRAA